MFDNFFYSFDKHLYSAGSDYALLFVFLVVGSFPLIAYMAMKIPRIMHAILLLFGLGAITYIPLTISKTALDNVYLHSGLITIWYINHTPYILRFATLWVIGLLSISGFWLVVILIQDVIHKKPITLKAIIKKDYQDALDLDLKIREKYSKPNEGI